jgi:hypothetical protein
MINFVSQPKIALSTSMGNIYICSIHENDIHMEESWKGHDYEAWIASFDQWNANVVYTGKELAYYYSIDDSI